MCGYFHLIMACWCTSSVVIYGNTPCAKLNEMSIHNAMLIIPLPGTLPIQLNVYLHVYWINLYIDTPLLKFYNAWLKWTLQSMLLQRVTNGFLHAVYVSESLKIWV